MLGAQLTLAGIQLVGDIVLARLLTPEDFGLFAMVFVIAGFAMQFRDFGLSAASIQAKELSDSQASNLFWANCALGVLMTVAFACTAPLLSRLYNESRLSAIVWGTSLAFLAGAVGIQHHARLTRQLQFSVISRSQITALVLSLIGAIALALCGFKHWSLVFLTVFRPLLTSILFWTSAGWLPGLPSAGQGTKRLVKFGTAVFGFDLVNYLSRNIDKVLIGRFFDASTLGLYNRAYQLFLLPIGQIRAPVSGAAMPILSANQANPTEYRPLFLGVVDQIATVAMPLMAWLSLTSTEVIVWVFGSRWEAGGKYLAWLSVAGLVQPTIGTLGLLLSSLGLGRRYFIWGCAHAATMSLAFIVGTRWGIEGMVISYVVANFLAALPAVVYCARGTPISAWDFLRSHRFAAAFTTLAGLVTVAVDLGLSLTAGSGVRLAVCSCVFWLVYLSQFLLFGSRRQQIRWLLASVLASRSGRIVGAAC